MACERARYASDRLEESCFQDAEGCPFVPAGESRAPHPVVDQPGADPGSNRGRKPCGCCRGGAVRARGAGASASPTAGPVTTNGASTNTVDLTPAWFAAQGSAPYLLGGSNTTYVLETNVTVPGTAFFSAAATTR